LPFYFRDEINLTKYCTTEDDVKAGISRKPEDEASIMNELSLSKKLDEYQEKKR